MNQSIDNYFPKNNLRVMNRKKQRTLGIVTPNNSSPDKSKPDGYITTPIKSRPTPIFLQKLYNMLEDNEHIHGVLSWSYSNDAAFTIHSIQSFTKKVLPEYFESSFNSFKRQLNYYGFQKINSTENDRQTVSYRHEKNLFQRGRLDLLGKIRRTTVNTDPKVEAEEMKNRIKVLEGQVQSIQKLVGYMQSYIKTIHHNSLSHQENVLSEEKDKHEESDNCKFERDSSLQSLQSSVYVAPNKNFENGQSLNLSSVCRSYSTESDDHWKCLLEILKYDDENCEGNSNDVKLKNMQLNCNSKIARSISTART